MGQLESLLAECDDMIRQASASLTKLVAEKSSIALASKLSKVLARNLVQREEVAAMLAAAREEYYRCFNELKEMRDHARGNKR